MKTFKVKNYKGNLVESLKKFSDLHKGMKIVEACEEEDNLKIKAEEFENKSDNKTVVKKIGNIVFCVLPSQSPNEDNDEIVNDDPKEIIYEFNQKTDGVYAVIDNSTEYDSQEQPNIFIGLVSRPSESFRFIEKYLKDEYFINKIDLELTETSDCLRIYGIDDDDTKIRIDFHPYKIDGDFFQLKK